MKLFSCSMCFNEALALCLSLIVILQVPVTASQRGEPEVSPQMQRIIQDFEGELYFAAKNLSTGQLITFRGDQQVQTASVIKVPIMVEAFHQASSGKLNLDARHPFDEENRVPGAGILQDLSPGGHISLRDAITLMIVLSDNSATNHVIDAVGISNVNQRMVELGLENTFLNKKVFLEASAKLPPERSRWGLGSTTALEMLGLFEKIYRKEAGDKESCDEMIRILKKQRDQDQIPRYLHGKNWHGIQIAHKTGALNRVRNDAGIVFTQQGDYILSIFAQDSTDEAKAC